MRETPPVMSQKPSSFSKERQLIIDQFVLEHTGRVWTTKDFRGSIHSAKEVSLLGEVFLAEL